MLQAKLPEVSNRADWISVALFTDPDTDELLDLSGATFAIFLNDETGCRRLSASTDVVSTGALQFTFTRDQMSTLCAAVYCLGATIERDGVTAQVLIASIPVVNGLVPK